jgi:hypothetical protein
MIRRPTLIEISSGLGILGSAIVGLLGEADIANTIWVFSNTPFIIYHWKNEKYFKNQFTATGKDEFWKCIKAEKAQKNMFIVYTAFALFGFIRFIKTIIGEIL